MSEKDHFRFNTVQLYYIYICVETIKGRGTCREIRQYASGKLEMSMNE
jgi:hypothetical protein